jgi:hypothetical protein
MFKMIADRFTRLGFFARRVECDQRSFSSSAKMASQPKTLTQSLRGNLEKAPAARAVFNDGTNLFGQDAESYTTSCDS